MNTSPRTYTLGFVNGTIVVACSDSFTWKKTVLLTGYDKVVFTQIGYSLMHAEFCLANTVHEQLHVELSARLSQYEHFNVKLEKSGTFLSSCVNKALLVKNPAVGAAITSIIRGLAEAIMEYEFQANVADFAETVAMTFQDTVA